MKKILLDGAWEGLRSSNGSTFPATVPDQRRTVSFVPAEGAEPEITCLGYTLA